jgi:transposase
MAKSAKPKAMTVKEFLAKFPDDDACLEHLMALRFGKEFTCPKCERMAKWYRLTGQPAYSCEWCGHHVHPMVGTPFAARPGRRCKSGSSRSTCSR